MEAGQSAGKGFQRTRIYYCNPSAPYQKAEIEVGHEFIRRVVPRGKSFDELAQKLGGHEVDAATINLTPGLLRK